MTTSPDSRRNTTYEPWFETIETLLAFQRGLLGVQCQVGLRILERVFPSADAGGPKGEPASADEVAPLEEIAAARMRQGLAPPPEIYRVPYRNRIDWAKFPDWARPSDPELFEGCAHEG